MVPGHPVQMVDGRAHLALRNEPHGAGLGRDRPFPFRGRLPFRGKSARAAGEGGGGRRRPGAARIPARPPGRSAAAMGQLAPRCPIPLPRLCDLRFSGSANTVRQLPREPPAAAGRVALPLAVGGPSAPADPLSSLRGPRWTSGPAEPASETAVEPAIDPSRTGHPRGVKLPALAGEQSERSDLRPRTLAPGPLPLPLAPGEGDTRPVSLTETPRRRPGRRLGPYRATPSGKLVGASRLL